MSITSNDNIGILNQILNDNIIKKTQPDIFTKILQFEIEKIHSNRIHFKSNLTEMNKAVLTNIQNITNEYLKTNNYSNQGLKTANNIVQVKNIALSEGEIKLNPRPTEFTDPNKNNLFDKQLKQQEDNFKSHNQPPKPKDIDFSDNFEEEPLKSETYDETMKQRELELKAIMGQHKQNTQEAEKWLKIDNNKDSLNKNKTVTFNIEDTPPSQPIIKNSVSFPPNNHLSNNSPNSLLNKLKTIKPSIENYSNIKISSQNKIEDMLNKILNNQDLILNNHELILNKLNNLSLPSSTYTSNSTLDSTSNSTLDSTSGY